MQAENQEQRKESKRAKKRELLFCSEFAGNRDREEMKRFA
jgi:hypothetical protein